MPDRPAVAKLNGPDNSLPTASGRRGSSAKLGAWAEDRACAYLREQGMVFLARNFRAAGGEIDLVMRDGATIAFVEVRLRRGRGYGGAAHSVGRIKQQRLVRAAEAWLQGNRSMQHSQCRFDVVALQGKPPDPAIEWLRSAFDA